MSERKDCILMSNEIRLHFVAEVEMLNRNRFYLLVSLGDKRRRLEGFYCSASANRPILSRFSVNNILALFSILIPEPISHAT